MATAAQSVKSYTFAWQGTDRRGNKTKGEIAGPNATMAKAMLRKQGIIPKVVRKKAQPISLLKPSIKPMDIAIFTRQMATMMKAGVPLVQAFDIVAEGLDNVTLKDLIITIKNEVSSGSSFAGAIKKHPKYFDELFCNLIESGEQSGALETMLDRVAIYKEKTEALKSKIKSAMKYPISVIVVALVVTGILLIKVVPQFEKTFAGFGADLPAFTKMVVNMSVFAQEWWLSIFVGIMVALFLFRETLVRSKTARDTVDAALLKAPIVGNIINQAAVARFSRTLSTTFAAGVPLVEALDSVAGASGNIVYYNAIKRIREDVTGGQQLHTSIRATGLFPNMLLQMVAIGEESGALDEMLDKVATYFEDEVDNAVDGLTSLMEPLIMAVLGILIGGLMVAMYMPIFMLGSVI